MSQPTGRVLCPRCGANNFDTVAVCWKCSAPLKQSPRQVAQQQAPSAAEPVAQPMLDSSMPRAVSLAGSGASTRTANRAALWLGLLMPYFGFPVGLAFMMCDDPRRQEVGRTCLIWSAISSVIHVLLMLVSLLGLRDALVPFLTGGRGMPQPPTSF